MNTTKLFVNIVGSNIVFRKMYIMFTVIRAKIILAMHGGLKDIEIKEVNEE